jgi:hypothetical protein
VLTRAVSWGSPWTRSSGAPLRLSRRCWTATWKTLTLTSRLIWALGIPSRPCSGLVAGYSSLRTSLAQSVPAPALAWGWVVSRCPTCPLGINPPLMLLPPLLPYYPPAPLLGCSANLVRSGAAPLTSHCTTATATTTVSMSTGSPLPHPAAWLEAALVPSRIPLGLQQAASP